MTPPTPAGIPAGTPLVSTTDFTVPVRLLQGPRGILLVESAAEIRARYAEVTDDTRIAYAALPEKELQDQLKRIDAARDQSIDLFGQIEQTRSADIQAFAFQFKVATIADQESAEGEAGQSQPRQELVYRRALAQRTFLQTDFPGFETFLKLRTDVALHVMRCVAERLVLTQDARDFLPMPAESSGAAEH